MKKKKLKVMAFFIMIVAMAVLVSGCIKVQKEKAEEGQSTATTPTQTSSKIKSLETTDTEKIVYNTKEGPYVIDADGSHEYRVGRYWPPVLLPDGRSLSEESAKAAFGGSMSKSPDGKKIAYKDYSPMAGGVPRYLISSDGSIPSGVVLISGTLTQSKIRVLTPDGTINLTDEEWEVTDPVWSPDGEKIAYASGWDITDSNLYIVNADGTNKKMLAQGYDRRTSYAWSPNGEKIAYVLNNDLYVEDDDGSKIMVSKNSLNPVWSPDGNKIVYLCEDSKSYFFKKLCLKDFSRINIEDIALTEKKASSVVWSPDGKNIFYMSDDQPLNTGWGASGIFVVNVDGTNNIRLTDAINGFTLSPDGRKIAYLTANNDLYIMNVDGNNQIKLKEGNVDKFAWSQDSERIAFISYLEVCTYETPIATPTPTPTPTPISTPVITSTSHGTIAKGGVITGGVTTVFGSCSSYSDLYIANINGDLNQITRQMGRSVIDDFVWSPASRLIGVESMEPIQ